MARKSNCISVLQFNERLIAWLRVRRSPSGIDVDAYEVHRGQWSIADGSLETALRSFVAERGIAADTVCSVLPRHEMTARILLLPSHHAAEVEGMVRLSAEEYVPYPAHELVIDQCILEKRNDGSARTLAVFAHRDVVEAHAELLRACGIGAGTHLREFRVPGQRCGGRQTGGMASTTPSSIWPRADSKSLSYVTVYSSMDAVSPRSRIGPR